MLALGFTSDRIGAAGARCSPRAALGPAGSPGPGRGSRRGTGPGRAGHTGGSGRRRLKSCSAPWRRPGAQAARAGPGWGSAGPVSSLPAKGQEEAAPCRPAHGLLLRGNTVERQPRGRFPHPRPSLGGGHAAATGQAARQLLRLVPRPGLPGAAGVKGGAGGSGARGCSSGPDGC